MMNVLPFPFNNFPAEQGGGRNPEEEEQGAESNKEQIHTSLLESYCIMTAWR